MKISWQKAVGQGEMLMVEENISDEVVKREGTAGILKRLRPGFEVGDRRLYELNIWMLDHMRVVKSLPPEQQMAVKMSVSILHGQATPDVSAEAVEQDRIQREEAVRAESASRAEPIEDQVKAAFPKAVEEDPRSSDEDVAAKAARLEAALER